MNKTRTLSAEERAKKSRRAYVWKPPVVPSWRGLFAGAGARKKVFAYWKGAGKFDLLDHVLFALFGMMPPRLGSAFGGWIGRNLIRKAFPNFVQQARVNLKMIRPELDDAGIETLIQSHFDNLSRVHTEFPLLKRITRSGRLTQRNAEAGIKIFKEEKLILIGLHTANWEITSPLVEQLGVPVTCFYKPPPRAGQIKFALKVRDQLGMKLLPPSIAGVRQALRLLQAREVVAIFGDEEYEGQVMAPFFGRPPHVNGNLAIAARLARMSGARVMIFHGERQPRGRYCVTFENATPLPSESDPNASLLDDVVALNAAIEPIIRAHCGKWFFLHLPFGGGYKLSTD